MKIFLASDFIVNAYYIHNIFRCTFFFLSLILQSTDFVEASHPNAGGAKKGGGREGGVQELHFEISTADCLLFFSRVRKKLHPLCVVSIFDSFFFSVSPSQKKK